MARPHWVWVVACLLIFLLATLGLELAEDRMPLARFSLYTVLGSGAWNGIWVGLGFAFGPAIRPVLEEWSGLISYAAVGVIALLVLWFVVSRLIRRVRAA